jgi:hypothetical protein
MLKIKDNVPLEELEKFGFKKQPIKNGYLGYYRCISKGAKIILILPDEALDRKREILVDKWWDSDPRVHKRPKVKYRSNIQVYDVLYDLIQAGLVEKVSDD